MEFKAKRRKIRVHIGEQTYELKIPTNGDIEDQQEKEEGKSPKEVMKLTYNFLEELGLPREAQRSMEQPDLLELVRLVYNPKND